MAKERHRLQHKHLTPLRDHLYASISADEILDRYIQPQPKSKNENAETFLKRIRDSAAKYQFVKIHFENQSYFVAFGVSGPIITPRGTFTAVPAQVVGGTWGTHYILIYPDLGKVLNGKSIHLRLDSGCYSGMVLGDVSCDCKNQLEKSQALCVKNNGGIIIHTPGHDGRGWGDYKLANQRIMNELHVDTVTAARLFYESEEEIDQRTYFESALIIKALGITEKHHLELATNNPDKISAFRSLNMHISTISPLIPEDISSLALQNLKAKSQHWNHNLGKSHSNK